MAKALNAALAMAVVLILAGCVAPEPPDASEAARGATGTVAAVVTEDYLFNAPVESECGYPAGELVEGSLPGAGDAGVPHIAAFQDGQSLTAVIGDFSGDGADDGALILTCTAGGGAWPHVLYFYSANRTVGRFALSDLADGQEACNEAPTSVRIGEDGVAVRWITAGECEAPCCGHLPISARFEWMSGGPRVREVREHYDRWRSSQLVERSRERPGASRAAAGDLANFPGRVILEVQKYEHEHGTLEDNISDCFDATAIPEHLRSASRSTTQSRCCQVAGTAYVVVSSDASDTTVEDFVTEP